MKTNIITSPTEQTYDELHTACAYFNEQLFRGSLPACLITMQRKRGVYGYFSGERWVNRDGQYTDEIAMNPAHFATRPVQGILSTLVHEMTHLWQHHFGKPGRGRYHNKEWAAKMDELGLSPSSTGKSGGERTGDRVSYYMVEGGPVDQACQALLKTGDFITWMDRAGEAGRGGSTTKHRDTSKTKYTCPRCGLNAWAKPSVTLICGACNKTLSA